MDSVEKVIFKGQNGAPPPPPNGQIWLIFHLKEIVWKTAWSIYIYFNTNLPKEDIDGFYWIALKVFFFKVQKVKLTR